MILGAWAEVVGAFFAQVRQNHELFIENEERSIKNKELCYKNTGFCIKNGLYRKRIHVSVSRPSGRPIRWRLH